MFTQVVIYTGDECDAETLAKRAADTFGTPPLRPIRVVCKGCDARIAHEKKVCA